MRKLWLAGVALALASTPPAFAHGGRSHSTSGWANWGDWGDWGFSTATLSGSYVFEASGFADDGKPGEVAVLGTLTFDGTSSVTGNLIFTRGDNSQYSCADSFTSPAGTYSITSSNSAPGLYSMTIPLAGTGNTGSINFGLLVPSPNGKSAQVIETDNGSLPSVQICGTPGITSMVLKGHLHALSD
jgi:hypothetical protein